MIRHHAMFKMSQGRICPCTWCRFYCLCCIHLTFRGSVHFSCVLKWIERVLPLWD